MVADFLRAKIRDGSRLSVVSAYFTIYAYYALKDCLNNVDHLDFLFGEPSFVNRLDPSKTEKKAFIIDAGGLELANKLQQKRVAKECADWIERKVDIKTIKQSNLLHGKMYHVATAGVEDAILGSSNFTVRGLGLGAAGNNIELNLIVDGNRDRQELKQWFDELWGNDVLVKDVKQDVLNYLKQLYENHTPEFIYYKTLYHIFEKFLGDAGKMDADLSKTSLFETDIWKALFEFQKDGAKGAINKILRHNGCIIADSVGLGKTYEALAVMKYFELKNERVLVLCPKKLRDNWTVYRSNSLLNPFVDDRFRYDVLSHTDLSREAGYSGDINLATLNWGNYDLIVIDESHNFRNNTLGKRDDDGNIIRRSRYQRLMEDIIKSGVRTKVLLLSATPVNNDLKDLRNQLYFLTENKDDAFAESIGVGSLKETLASAQKVFSHWAKKQTAERKTGELLEKLSAAFFKLLDELTIARSRKHIQKYYKATIAQLGGFPKREKPVSIYPEIDLRGRFLSYDKLNDEIAGYKLALFNPSRFVLPDHKADYEKKGAFPFTQGQRETFLIGMMKVNFLKRLESSVKSFEITMERTIAKIEGLETKIKNFQALPTQNPDSEELELELDDPGHDEELEDAMQVGGKLKFRLNHLRLNDEDGKEGWLKALKRDKDQLRILYNAAQDVTPATDAKLAELKKLIAAKVAKPTTNKLGELNRKVLVFTAFADTATYLYESLLDWACKELGIDVALVCGGGDTRTTFGNGAYDQILTNFSPRAKHRAKIPSMPQRGEIDLLIATDCISEGQNLQDCDYLVNYDIHWNPVRIIQRFGRIDRIGSVSHTVHLVNFWPTEDLNKYINLKNRVEARMALVDLSATFEDNVLKNEEIEDIISDDLRYRDKQLLRLKDEVLDIEDLGDSVSLTEFTLDDFRLELLKYIEANKQALEDAPFGLYTCVPPHPDYKIIGPGVIFCFRLEGQRGGGTDAKPAPSESINPLHPYFLVYVLDDGNVRFGFAHPKQILDIYRVLCSGNTEAYGQLCNLFDQQTNHGSDMKTYDHLLKKAVDSLASTFRKRAASGLQSRRGFVLPDAKEQVHDKTDLELVTWLVIKAP
ncbi:MAG: helicase-related protein [Chthoniobacter sp.]|uniref:helicase-related protein n=1 Tax=Chthoniobacter sp. TaxID=2510640 RepID=UPI0032AAD8F3